MLCRLFMLASEKLHHLLHQRARHTLCGKTAQTICCFVALAAAPYLIPGLSRWRLLLPAPSVSVLSPAPPQAAAPPQLQQIQAQTKPGEIEDASGRALDHFFSALLKAETGAARVVVSHYGDSPITGDGITSTVRRKLQLRFGDAGHGFVLTARPWGWYNHVGVRHDASGWVSDPMFISRGDHLFGYGGASFKTSAAGATATFSTADEGEVGRSVSAFDLYFLAQPGGGEFEVEVDGALHSRVTTGSETIHSGFHQAKVAAGAHTLTIRTIGNGEVRMFGVALANGERGVEYDSLGDNGAFIGLLANYMNESHWTEQLRRRRPDLVILNYGANESEFENWPMDKYERDTKEVIRRIRAALPEASILFVGPMDRGTRAKGGAIITRPTIPKLIAAQRRFATETGCAFFDTFAAMGGEGTVARWLTAKPKLMGGDFTHPTWQGSEVVGSLIHDAIIRAYENYKHQPLAKKPLAE
jgi:lysophospholipase L1-like esterase